MEVFKVSCPNIRWIKAFGERPHKDFDSFVKCNAVDNNIEELVFLDSRGVGRSFSGLLAEKIITKNHLKKSYILVCRPLELTTWATLINFISLNELNPKKIITNMGLVDFTPKKKHLLKDAIQQVDYLIGKKVAKAIFAEKYISINGNKINLYCMQYSDEYKKSIEKITRKIPTIIINTPIVSDSIKIERKRPHCFFTSLAQTVAFNQSINYAKVVNLPVFDETLTYDAVHFTTAGNELIFNIIKEYL